MNKVKAAISAGNRFVLTSRSHIWYAAKSKLATRSHPRFADEAAIVNVGHLSPEERAQILYNHIKAGDQPARWKSRVKPHLTGLSMQTDLLPEIARRLGNRSYTGAIHTLPDDLERYVAEPMEFLKDTIGELNDAQRAALTLIFLRRSQLPVTARDHELWGLVADKFGVNQIEIGDALDQLKGTFVVTKTERDNAIWSFAHPTIADAISAILGKRPDLVELYLRGTRIEALLSEVACSSSDKFRDAVVVTESVSDLLVSRLIETPDESGLNRSLFTFLCERASNAVLRAVVVRDPSLLSRYTGSLWSAGYDPKVLLHARAHSLGLLPALLRRETAEHLEACLFDHLDGTFLWDEDILSLIPPKHLLTLSARVKSQLLGRLPDRIRDINEEPDLDIEPSDNFDDIRSLLYRLDSAFSDDDQIQHHIADVEAEIEVSVGKIAEKKKNAVPWEGEDVSPSQITPAKEGRSIFSDVDG
jgi:hypothetical protein